MKLSALNPFRFRALLPGVLAVGLLLGIWLGDLFKGFGWGPGQGGSSTSGNSSQQTTGDSTDEEADLVGVHATDSVVRTAAQTEKEEGSTSPVTGGQLHILIDGRNYYIVRGKKRESIGLKSLISLIKQTEPNDDGGRAVVDLTRDSRPTAEENLKKSLQEAGLSEAVYWPGRAVP